ncbi:MAG: hypothetical protein ABIH34_00315 [Nanoarchaeota archaeon]
MLRWIIILMFLVSCTPIAQTPPGQVWMEKELTQCAEEWQRWVFDNFQDDPRMAMSASYARNEMMADGFVAYYQEQGITIAEIKVEEINYYGVRCEACNCLGSTRFKILIDEEHADHFSERGYT